MLTTGFSEYVIVVLRIELHTLAIQAMQHLASSLLLTVYFAIPNLHKAYLLPVCYTTPTLSSLLTCSCPSFSNPGQVSPKNCLAPCCCKSSPTPHGTLLPFPPGLHCPCQYRITTIRAYLTSFFFLK